MPVEKSAGAITFRKDFNPPTALPPKRAPGKIFYLLLHYQAGHWDFLKGNIEKGEKLEDTVKREVKEETGIENIKFVPKFEEVIKYFYKLKGKNIFKIVTFFLAETEAKKVKISWEHIGYKWLPYQEALEQLTFKNAKGILKKANDFLSQKYDGKKSKTEPCDSRARWKKRTKSSSPTELPKGAKVKKRTKFSSPYVIGVDGGGTKTELVLANLNGKILKIAKSGPANLRNVGIKKAVENIAEGMAKILPEDKKIKIVSIFVGLPALEEEFKFKLKEIEKEFFNQKKIAKIFKGKVTIGSDQIVAFKSGTEEVDGVVLIVGTGCVAHGWKDKKEYKASGRGWLADEGSAFWIGQKVFQAIWKDLDGRGPKTLLKDFVFHRFRIKKQDPDLLNQKIYSQNFIEVIAPLSFICDLAAKNGDKLAKDILIEAGKELVLPIKAVVKKLNFSKEKFPLVLVGGVLKSNTVLNTLKKEVKKVAPKAEFIIPKRNAVAGAVKLAIEKLKNKKYATFS